MVRNLTNHLVCPNQDSLVNILKYNIPASVVNDAVRDVRQAAGPESIDRILKEYGIDAIIVPTDSDIHKLASFSGTEIWGHDTQSFHANLQRRLSYGHYAPRLSGS